MAGHVWIGEAGVWQAADGYSGPYVFSAVRDSRMWCPHDIGRDSWVWGEQETLCNILSPHEVGEEALTDVDHLVGRKRGGPGVKSLLLLLNLIITN